MSLLPSQAGLHKERDWLLNVVATPRGPESLLHCGPFDVKAKTTEQTALACQKGQGRGGGGGWGGGGAPNTREVQLVVAR